MRKYTLTFLGAIALGWLLSGWGYTGHYTITEQAGNLLENKIKGFDQWVPFITDHSSDPDYRKFWVKSEVPKHFIDLDNYPEFIANGYLTFNYDTLVKLHGEQFVNEQGTLPWATLAAYDSLRSSFERKDWVSARIWAANLSHYVGDGFMPLHASRNYDGQETGNKGIHTRYESKMVLPYALDLKSNSKPIGPIKNIPDFIMNYIGSSNHLCDSILHADNKARQLAGNTDSPDYIAALWENTGSMTVNQFSKASTALASLIYSAWKEAGSPSLKNIPLPKENQFSCAIISAIQNNEGTQLTVNIQVFKKDTYKIDLRTADGGPMIKGGKWDREPGNYDVLIDITALEKGLYLIELDCAAYASTIKFTKK